MDPLPWKGNLLVAQGVGPCGTNPGKVQKSKKVPNGTACWFCALENLTEKNNVFHLFYAKIDFVVLSISVNHQAVPFGTFCFIVFVPRIGPAGADILGYQQIPLSGEGGRFIIVSSGDEVRVQCQYGLTWRFPPKPCGQIYFTSSPTPVRARTLPITQLPAASKHLSLAWIPRKEYRQFPSCLCCG